MSTVHETCACGATFDYDGTQATTMTGRWRKEHRCTIPEAGSCFHDPGVTWPNGDHPRCELRAGHTGAHECDRGSYIGKAIWDDGAGRVEPLPCDDQAEQ